MLQVHRGIGLDPTSWLVSAVLEVLLQTREFVGGQRCEQPILWYERRLRAFRHAHLLANASIANWPSRLLDGPPERWLDLKATSWCVRSVQTRRGQCSTTRSLLRYVTGGSRSGAAPGDGGVALPKGPTHARYEHTGPIGL